MKELQEIITQCKVKCSFCLTAFGTFLRIKLSTNLREKETDPHFFCSLFRVQLVSTRAYSSNPLLFLLDPVNPPPFLLLVIHLYVFIEEQKVSRRSWKSFTVNRHLRVAHRFSSVTWSPSFSSLSPLPSTRPFQRQEGREIAVSLE